MGDNLHQEKTEEGKRSGTDKRTMFGLFYTEPLPTNFYFNARSFVFQLFHNVWKPWKQNVRAKRGPSAQ